MEHFKSNLQIYLNECCHRENKWICLNSSVEREGQTQWDSGTNTLNTVVTSTRGFKFSFYSYSVCNSLLSESIFLWVHMYLPLCSWSSYMVRLHSSRWRLVPAGRSNVCSFNQKRTVSASVRKPINQTVIYLWGRPAREKNSISCYSKMPQNNTFTSKWQSPRVPAGNRTLPE